MKEISKASLGDIGMILGIALIWGTAFPAIRAIVPELGTFWAAGARVGVGFAAVFVLFLSVAFFRGARLPYQPATLGLIALISFLNIVLPFILISWALLHVEAGVGSLLLATTPFWAMILGPVFTRDEKITMPKFVGVCFALSGIGILVGPDAFSGLASGVLLPKLAILAAAICYILASFLMRRVTMSTIPFTTIALACGAAMILPLTFFAAGPPPLEVSPYIFWVVLWLGVFPTGLAHLLRFIAVQRVGVSTFSLGMNTIPVFSIIIAAFTLGEEIHLTTLTALACVISGLLISRRDRILPLKPHKA